MPSTNDWGDVAVADPGTNEWGDQAVAASAPKPAVPPGPKWNGQVAKRPFAGRVADVVAGAIGEPSGLGLAGWTGAIAHPIDTLSRPVIPESVTKPFKYALTSSAGDVVASLPGATPGFRKAVEGEVGGLANVAESIATPLTAVAGPLLGEGGAAAQAVKGAFAAQMATQAPESFKQFQHALKYGKESDIAEATTGLAAAVGLPVAMVHAELARAKPAPIVPPDQGPPAPGSIIRMPEGARPTPEVPLREVPPPAPIPPKTPPVAAIAPPRAVPGPVEVKPENVTTSDAPVTPSKPVEAAPAPAAKPPASVPPASAEPRNSLGQTREEEEQLLLERKAKHDRDQSGWTQEEIDKRNALTKEKLKYQQGWLSGDKAAGQEFERLSREIYVLENRHGGTQPKIAAPAAAPAPEAKPAEAPTAAKADELSSPSISVEAPRRAKKMTPLDNRIQEAESALYSLSGLDSSLVNGLRLNAHKLNWTDEKYASALEDSVGKLTAKEAKTSPVTPSKELAAPAPAPEANPSQPKPVQPQSGLAPGSTMSAGEPPLPTGPGAARPHDIGVDQEALGLKPGNETLARIQRATTNFGRGIAQIFSRHAIKVDLPKLANAADNIPRMTGQAAGNSLRLRGTEQQLNATTFVMQAMKMSGPAPLVPKPGGARYYPGDPRAYLEAQLTDLQTAAQQFRNQKQQIEANAAIKAAQSVKYAIAHFAELQPLAERAKNQLDSQYKRDVRAGVNVAYEDWYVPQRHDIDLLTSSTGPVVLGHSKGGGVSTQFQKGKSFDDYSSAIQAKFVPRTLNIADLVENRVYQGEKIVQRKAFFDQMRAMKDAADGKPLVTDIPKIKVQRPDGTTDMQERVPIGYNRMEIMPGMAVAMHSGYHRLVNALTASSQIAESAVVGTLQDLAAVEKHIGLALDTFHVSRTLQRAATITHQAILGDTLKRGLALVEYQTRDLPQAVQNGVITQDMADWAARPRTIEVQGRPLTESRIVTVKFGVKNGLNAGRVADVIYRQWLQDFPVTGAVQKWVFDKMTRSAITQSYLVEFERVAKANPDLDRTAVARKVASDLNVLFGNLQKESIFKNPSVRSVNQILFLAPQWVEGLARGEMRGAKQIGQAAYGAATGKGFNIGTAGKSVGTGLAAYFIGTQLLNLATRHQLTFQNKEEGHKLDAWIPDITGKPPGFFISPLSVFAEITHDVLRYSREKPSVADAATQIAENKLGNLGRAMMVMGTGKDPVTNQKLVGTAARAVKAATQLVPVPISVSQGSRAIGSKIAPGLIDPPKPGAVQRQITSSLGFKTEPAKTAAMQARDMAKTWASKSDDPKIKEEYERELQSTFAPSVYNPLRDALGGADLKKAQAAYDKLRLTRTKKEVDKVLNPLDREGHPSPPRFTGSKANERKFMDSLDHAQLKVYEAAVAERHKIRDNYLSLKRK
jgi:hypothetical protein